MHTTMGSLSGDFGWMHDITKVQVICACFGGILSLYHLCMRTVLESSCHESCVMSYLSGNVVNSIWNDNHPQYINMVIMGLLSARMVIISGLHCFWDYWWEQ